MLFMLVKADGNSPPGYRSTRKYGAESTTDSPNQPIALSEPTVLVRISLFITKIIPFCTMWTKAHSPPSQEVTEQNRIIFYYSPHNMLRSVAESPLRRMTAVITLHTGIFCTAGVLVCF